MIVSELRQRYSLKYLLKLSRLARSTYYYYLKHSTENKYEADKAEMQQIHTTNKGRYGYRRITIEMRNRGDNLNHKTVLKLMKELGIRGKQRKMDNIILTKVLWVS